MIGWEVIQMIKVKVSNQDSSAKLEESINKFLIQMQSEYSNFKLVDVKYATGTSGEDREEYHSSVIIYEI